MIFDSYLKCQASVSECVVLPLMRVGMASLARKLIVFSASMPGWIGPFVVSL